MENHTLTNKKCHTDFLYYTEKRLIMDIYLGMK